MPFTNSCPFLLDYFCPLSFLHLHIHHFLPRRVLGVAWWPKGVHPHLCHWLTFNTPLAKSHGKSLWSSRSECSLFQSAVIQVCRGHTRLYKLTLIALKELSLTHVREVAYRAEVLAELVFRLGRDQLRYVSPGRVWSDHYNFKPYDSANPARSKPESSRFKVKIKRRIET